MHERKGFNPNRYQEQLEEILKKTTWISQIEYICCENYVHKNECKLDNSTLADNLLSFVNVNFYITLLSGSNLTPKNVYLIQSSV